MKPCRALNAAGTGPSIPGRMVYGAEAVAVRIRIALLTIRGYWPDDTFHGLPLRRWIEAPNTSAVAIEGAVRLLLQTIEGVSSVVRVDATTGATITIAATVRAEVDGRTVVVRVGDLEDPRTPGAWYLLTPAPILR